MVQVIQQFSKGEVVIPEGSKGDRVYRIISGEVLICKQGGNRKMVPIARLSNGEIFGEMYLFDGSGVRTASAVASTELKVEVFFEEDIQDELKHSPPEISQMLTAFSKRLRNTTGNFAGLFKDKGISELPNGSLNSYRPPEPSLDHQAEVVNPGSQAVRSKLSEEYPPRAY